MQIQVRNSCGDLVVRADCLAFDFGFGGPVRVFRESSVTGSADFFGGRGRRTTAVERLRYEMREGLEGFIVSCRS